MKKKILYIASLDSIHSLKWINFFINLNYEVSVISLTKKLKNFKFSKEINLYVYDKYQSKLLNFLYCISSILFNRKNFLQNDIIHVHYIGFNGLISLFLKNRNLVLTAWGDDIKKNYRNIFKNFFIKLLFKKSKIITTDSNEMKNLMCKIDQKVKSKVKIINFGIDTNFFSKKKYSLQIESKLKLRKFKDSLKIISLRNHEKNYDIQTLILSIKKLLDSNFSAVSLIYGTGPETNNLKKLSENLNLQNRIFFMGSYQQKELPLIFSIVDCYVSTSLSDGGISASTAEAMSCELVSISSNNSDNSLWIEQGKTGFLFENKNVDELSDILKNLKNFDLIKIGNESRKIILKNNDYNNEMNKVEIIYNNLIK